MGVHIPQHDVHDRALLGVGSVVLAPPFTEKLQSVVGEGGGRGLNPPPSGGTPNHCQDTLLVSQLLAKITPGFKTIGLCETLGASCSLAFHGFHRTFPLHVVRLVPLNVEAAVYNEAGRPESHR